MAADQDAELIGKGISALQRLLEYADVSHPSEWLIETDIARLASYAGKADLAREILQEALRSQHPVIVRRVSHDEALNAVQQAIKSDN